MSIKIDLLPEKKKKTQLLHQNIHHQFDSGFVSCTSSLFNDNSYSMKVAHSSLINDHVKDLQVEFAGINNFDDIPMKNVENSNQVQQHQVPIYKQPMQYFVQNEDGDTQLHISIDTDYINIALWLIENAPHPSLLDIENDDCLTALHLATMSKQTKIIRRLVLCGANTTITTPRLYQPWTSRGNAAIHMACEANDCESVKALTEPLSSEEQYWLACNQRVSPILGRDLELRNYDGINPMHTAIKRGNLEIVKQLVKVGAKVNSVDPCSGLTSLHQAIVHKQRHIVEYMAKEHKSCLNEPTRYGKYSYEFAVSIDKQLAEDLVQWGASPIIRDSDDSDSYSESDSEESMNDDSDDYPMLNSCVNVYPRSMVTTTLITT